MLLYLIATALFYGVFLLRQRRDRQRRQAFASRLRALYHVRGEFWRMRAWAADARARGDAEGAARFIREAAALIPGITGASTGLRRDDPELAGELGWTAGVLDEELADMGGAMTAADLRPFERWITGRGRPPVDAVLNPRPAMEDDARSERVHTLIGAAVGGSGGFASWMVLYWGRMDATLGGMGFFILLGAIVVGHVAGATRRRLWAALYRFRSGWIRPA